MLIGEYRHTIDTKNRVALPAKFRKEIGRKIVVTRGLDNCLLIYTLKKWQQVAEDLAAPTIGSADVRNFNRYLLGGAVEVDVDSIGRVLLPEFLRQYAGLKTKVVIAGLHSRVEIWAEDKWNEITGKIEKEAENLAEKLGQIGMI
ncbi:MAG: division/cell wall cluster transcriptional repressor MraZ [Candidatus Paceibacterota bacterium]